MLNLKVSRLDVISLHPLLVYLLHPALLHHFDVGAIFRDVHVFWRVELAADEVCDFGGEVENVAAAHFDALPLDSVLRERHQRCNADVYLTEAGEEKKTRWHTRTSCSIEVQHSTNLCSGCEDRMDSTSSPIMTEGKWVLRVCTVGIPVIFELVKGFQRTNVCCTGAVVRLSRG